MNNQRNNSNYFDDMDLWENPSTPPKASTPTDFKATRKDDLDNFYDDAISDSGLPKHRSSSRSRKQKKQLLKLLVAAVLVIFVSIKFFSNHQDDPDVNPPNVDPPSSQPTSIEIIPTEPIPVPTEAPLSVILPSEYRYFGKMLTADQQKIYDIIRDGISRREDNIGPFHVKSEAELQLIIQSLSYDWPEYFWFRGGYSGSYYTMDSYLEYTLSPSYAFSKDEYADCAAYVEAQTQGIIQSLSGKSDYEKVKGVYEFLIDRTIYDLDYTGTTIYELFHDGRAVCEGYARASQYLLTKLGVETLYACGNAGLYTQPRSQWEGHAWNIVNIEGIYYQLDTTWGDPVCDDGIQRKSFDYLNLTDEEMARRHEREEWNYYPPCTDVMFNYFYVEGRYLDSFNKDIVTAWFQESYSRGEGLTFKCSNDSIYNSVRNWLYADGGVAELFRTVKPDGSGYSYSYSYSDDLYILHLEES